jgi:hypothetical protein
VGTCGLVIVFGSVLDKTTGEAISVTDRRESRLYRSRQRTGTLRPTYPEVAGRRSTLQTRPAACSPGDRHFWDSVSGGFGDELLDRLRKRPRDTENGIPSAHVTLTPRSCAVG